MRTRYALALVVVALASGVCPAWAGDEPLTPEQSADGVIAALADEDTVALDALARKDDPDPWLVADALCHRRAYAAADAFAKAAPRVDVAKLPAYVASRRGEAPDDEARQALTAMSEALKRKAWQAALDAAGGVTGPLKTVARVRVAVDRGRALGSLGRYRESADAYLQAAEAAERLGWMAQAAVTFYRAGVSAHYGALWQTVLHAGEARLRVARLRDSKIEIARSLSSIGNAQSGLGNHEKAQRAFEASIEVGRALGDPDTIANALGNLGFMQAGLGQHDEALRNYEDALTIKRTLDDHVSTARTLVNLGNLHDRLGHYPKAMAYFEECLALREASGDELGAAQTLRSIGIDHDRLGNLEKALDCFQQGLARMRKLGNQPGVANALESTAIVQRQLGDYRGALASAEEASEFHHTVGGANLASYLGNVGVIHSSLGNFEEAISFHMRALTLSEERHNERGMTQALNNLGLVYTTLGDYPRAFAFLDRALALEEALGDRAGIASALGNVGLVHMQLGNHRRALHCAERTLALEEELGRKAAVAGSLINIGTIHEAQGEYTEALQHFERGRALAEAAGQRRWAVHALHNIGVVHMRLGDLARALGCFERALKGVQALEYQDGIAWAHASIGEVHLEMGAIQEALASYQRSLQEAERLGVSMTSARSWWGLAEAHLALGDPAAAAREARQGVRKTLGLTGGLAEGEGAGVRDSYAGLFDAGVRAATARDDAADLAWFLEQGRAGSLREALGSRAALEAATLPDALRKDLLEARAEQRRTLHAHRRASEGAELKARRTARRAWEQAQARVEDVMTRIQREAKAAASVTLGSTDDLATIQSYLAPDEALVLYHLTDAEGMALVVEVGDARIVPLEGSERVDARAAQLRRLGFPPEPSEPGARPTDAPADPAEAIATLRNLLVQPLGLGAHVVRVLVSPMGQLGYVPFALLFPAREVAYVPSGTTYGLLREDGGNAGEQILGLGDPDYRTAVNESAVGVHRGGAVTGLPRLPATRGEIEAVATRKLLGKEATESGLGAALARQTRWRAVHFACHGLVDPDRPMLSTLALTADEEEDGFLTALEIFRMKMPADLVVMSACETAKGKIYQTEGIVGLTRAFMFAGAPRVICSLWKVDDEATQALMIKFYELWNPRASPADPERPQGVEGSRPRGLGAAAALKKAQAFVRGHEKWKHPHYWAAWVLWGLPN